jgi:hypothetical protein
MIRKIRNCIKKNYFLMRIEYSNEFKFINLKVKKRIGVIFHNNSHESIRNQSTCFFIKI